MCVETKKREGIVRRLLVEGKLANGQILCRVAYGRRGKFQLSSKTAKIDLDRLKERRFYQPCRLPETRKNGK